MKRLIISLLITLLIVLIGGILLLIQYFFNDFIKYFILFSAFCFLWYIVYISISVSKELKK